MLRPLSILAAFAGIGILACRDAAVSAPEGSTPFDAPAVYAKWWQSVEACSGESGRLSSVAWIMAPQGTPLMVKGTPVDAYWEANGNFIVLSDGTRYAGALVRHEMLHAITRSTRHSRAFYLEKCAGVVSCGPSCVADAAPITVPAITPVVPPDSIDVWSTVEPSA